jgi:Uma2 family endonuclease
MTQIISPTSSMPNPPAYDVSFPENLPSEDNQNMDSPWHRFQMELLINVIETNWKGRDFYCGGNMFIHFSREHIRNRDFRGPDFFVVLNVDHDRPRDYWAVWEENGRYPNLIVELLSPKTSREDLTTKKDIYEQTFRTREYFCFDPDGYRLQGWRLDRRYRPIPVENGRMWSEEFEMWLGIWQGTWDGHNMTWLRFFDREGKMLPTEGEKEAARADTEAARADDAVAEVQRLRDEIEALRRQSAKSNT